MTTDSLRKEIQSQIDHARKAHHPGDVQHFRAMMQLAKGPLAPDPYDITTIRGGHKLDQLTHYALLTVEHRLGFKPRSLDVLQGSYNPVKGKEGVPASGGTHDGGGAVDLSPVEWQAKVRALRAIGFAAWHRPAIKGLWGEHVHAVLISNRKLSDAAKAQVRDYQLHKDGLAGHAPDPSWHPDPIPLYRMPIYAMTGA